MHNSPFARIKKPLKSDMNVLPYIDVMLVLLVIFMTTAPMLTTALTVNLPEAPSDTIATNQQHVAIVTIAASGQYYVRLGNGQDSPLALAEIKGVLAEEEQRLHAEKQQLLVLVNGDKTIPYGNVARLMSSLQEVGLKRVGLLTEVPKT